MKTDLKNCNLLPYRYDKSILLIFFSLLSGLFINIYAQETITRGGVTLTKMSAQQIRHELYGKYYVDRPRDDMWYDAANETLGFIVDNNGIQLVNDFAQMVFPSRGSGNINGTITESALYYNGKWYKYTDYNENVVYLFSECECDITIMKFANTKWVENDVLHEEAAPRGKGIVLLHTQDGIWYYCSKNVKEPFRKLSQADIEAEQARLKEEQERKEQLRKQEEQKRIREQQLKEMPKRLPEIEKLIKTGCKDEQHGYMIPCVTSQSKFPEYLQYYCSIIKNSYSERFKLFFKFTKEGKMYMWTEIPDKLAELFPYMQLEGTVQQWESGYWKIELDWSNQKIANNINYIINQMRAANKSYDGKVRESPQYEQEFQRSKKEISSILSHPLGNGYLYWPETRKDFAKFIKSIRDFYPWLQIDKSHIYGRIPNQKPFFQFGTDSDDWLTIDVVTIDLGKSKEDPIIVKYRLTTSSKKESRPEYFRIIRTLSRMDFKRDNTTKEYTGIVGGIKIESLKVEKTNDSTIELSFSIPR